MKVIKGNLSPTVGAFYFYHGIQCGKSDTHIGGVNSNTAIAGS